MPRSWDELAPRALSTLQAGLPTLRAQGRARLCTPAASQQPETQLLHRKAASQVAAHRAGLCGLCRSPWEWAPAAPFPDHPGSMKGLGPSTSLLVWPWAPTPGPHDTCLGQGEPANRCPDAPSLTSHGCSPVSVARFRSLCLCGACWTQLGLLWGPCSAQPSPGLLLSRLPDSITGLEG